MNDNEITIKEAQELTGLSRQRINQAIIDYKIGFLNRWGRRILNRDEVNLIIERKGMQGKKLSLK